MKYDLENGRPSGSGGAKAGEVDFWERCPDCETSIGHAHRKDCDIERCSSCHRQRIQCHCDDHDPEQSAWTGFWPPSKPIRAALTPIQQMQIALRGMVRREYEADLLIVYFGDYESYLIAIRDLCNRPLEFRRAIAVSVCVDGVELLRYPHFDVEFQQRKGAVKCGVTGDPVRIEELFELMGGGEN